MTNQEQETCLLADEEKDWTDRSFCARCNSRAPSRSLSKYKLLVVVETVQILVLILGFAIFSMRQKPYNDSEADRYLSLSQYNLSRRGFEVVNAADPTREANEWWDGIMRSTGLIALSKTWPADHELPPTMSHPDNADMNLYQVNTFHSLHCLYRVRNRLISNLTLEQWPRNDMHTLHCIDHIREDLMCNPDMSLRGTENYVSFDTMAPRGQQCRDLNAVQKWAAEHEWAGYYDYLENVLHLDPVQTEIDAWRQQHELEKEVGRRLPYDSFKIRYNPDTGKITLGLV